MIAMHVIHGLHNVYNTEKIKPIKKFVGNKKKKKLYRHTLAEKN